MTEASPHIPVLVEEVVHALAVAPGETHVDGTFGAGGYSKAILAKGAARVFAFDRDPDAIRYGEALAASGERLTLVPECFSRMRQALTARGVDEVDGVTLDIGVSSMQLDRARARLLVPGRRAARHADEPGRPQRRRFRQRGGRGGARRRDLPLMARSRSRAGSPGRSSRRGRSSGPASSPRWSARRSAIIRA